MKFKVIDLQTDEEAHLYNIVLESYKAKTWAKNLIYCDIEGWAIEEDGTLIVVDECGNFAYPPQSRFKIVVLESNPKPLEEKEKQNFPWKDCGKPKRPVSKQVVLRIALEVGFSISTAYGQESGKLMPISDSKTLERFAQALAEINEGEK